MISVLVSQNWEMLAARQSESRQNWLCFHIHMYILCMFLHHVTLFWIYCLFLLLHTTLESHWIGQPYKSTEYVNKCHLGRLLLHSQTNSVFFLKKQNLCFILLVFIKLAQRACCFFSSEYFTELIFSWKHNIFGLHCEYCKFLFLQNVFQIFLYHARVGDKEMVEKVKPWWLHLKR